MKLITMLGALMVMATSAHAEMYHVYVGTYTRGASEGIYLLDFDSETGTLTNLRLAGKTENPSFLALHPHRSRPLLFAVGEQSDGGAVSAFKIGPDGLLTFRDKVSSHGSGPCHISVHRSGASLAIANYGGGNFVRFKLDDDRIGERTSDIIYREPGPNKPRQDKAHAHGVTHTPDGRYLILSDLGTDAIGVFEHESTDSALATNILVDTRREVRMKPGAGPRHVAAHPTQPLAYVVNELDSTVTVLRIPEEGPLEILQSVSTLPNTFSESNTTAEIFVHPSGKFVYASNRGHDSVAEFRINDDGTIAPIGHTKTGGKQPRNFNIDPDGNYILAANQKTEEITVLKIDQDHGHLTPTGVQVDVPTPVCVVFRKP